jgi:6-phosphogluconolactonase
MSKINIYPSLNQMITAAADLFIKSASEAIRERGVFTTALSGGSTPLPLYQLLAQSSSDNKLDWNKIQFFWGDERVVPPSHPDSNYYQANQSLLLPRQIPEAHIHRIQGELDPEIAADLYQQELLNWFSGPLPNFDLILLGMGADGHTASLFPGTRAVLHPAEYDLVAANHVPQQGNWRITSTAKLINAAKQVLFLIAGESKAETLYKVIKEQPLPDKYPIQLIRPTNGKLVWLVDQEAGSLLLNQ